MYKYYISLCSENVNPVNLYSRVQRHNGTTCTDNTLLQESLLSEQQSSIFFSTTEQNQTLKALGVPQGIIFGPLFYIAYMNNIVNVFAIIYSIIPQDKNIMVL